jgi:hypothetical protein
LVNWLLQRHGEVTAEQVKIHHKSTKEEGIQETEDRRQNKTF